MVFVEQRNKSPLSIISLRWKFCLIKQYRIENCENQRQYSLQKSNKLNFTVKIMLGYSFNSFIWFWNYVFVWMPNCELFCSILIWRNQKKTPKRKRDKNKPSKCGTHCKNQCVSKYTKKWIKWIFINKSTVIYSRLNLIIRFMHHTKFHQIKNFMRLWKLIKSKVSAIFHELSVKVFGFQKTHK